MKLLLPLSTLLVLLPVFVQAHSSSENVFARQSKNFRPFARQRGGQGGNNRNNQNNNQNNGNNNGAAASSSSAAPPAATVNPTGQAQNGNGGADLQTSLQLDPSQVQSGLAQDGQAVPADGQVASKTSVNNFINFCATVNLPLTNGQQVVDGSCNPTIMGVIISKSRMPSSKFQNPKNLDTLQANTPFTIQMRINNLETGFFVNAQQNYFAAPAFTNGQGILQGHSHVVIEKVDSLETTTVTNPQEFAFFKGFNAKAQNGILTADVTAGLPEGVYRMGSINTAANHQPAMVAVAQHGMLDDAVYFTVTANGNPAGGAGNNTGNQQNNQQGNNQQGNNQQGNNQQGNNQQGNNQQGNNQQGNNQQGNNQQGNNQQGNNQQNNGRPPNNQQNRPPNRNAQGNGQNNNQRGRNNRFTPPRQQRGRFGQRGRGRGRN